jgi:hypothetical protein
MTSFCLCYLGCNLLSSSSFPPAAPAAIRLRVIMSGTLEKVSLMKAYGGDLIKYKFKVGRAS